MQLAAAFVVAAVDGFETDDAQRVADFPITLIKHESIEYDLMKSGINYIAAHRIAQKRYNYAKGLIEFEKGGM